MIRIGVNEFHLVPAHLGSPRQRAVKQLLLLLLLGMSVSVMLQSYQWNS